MLFSISLFNVALFSMTLFNVALVSRTVKINIYYKCFFFEKYPSLYMLDIFLFYWWILVVVRKVRKYPHMSSSSLGAKGGGAVIRNGGEEGGGEKRECTLCLYSFVQKKILYFVHFNSGNVRCVSNLLFK